jgi:hypothetical protein
MEAFAQLGESNFPDFIRYGLTQVTHGSIGDELAARMLERVPIDLGRGISVPDALCVSPQFADALREFCLALPETKARTAR